MKKLKSLSVFFPAYNDAENLPSLVSKIYSILPAVAKKYEVIIINDGSKDNTKDVATELSQKYKNLKVLSHKKNKGYGGALISGFKLASYEWIFYTDGDGQYDPSEIMALVEKVKPDIDVINGYKIDRADGTLRKVVGELNNKILHTLFSIPISDIDCDFRLIRKKALKNISLTFRSGTICPELIMKLKYKGAQFAETPVHHYNRTHGKSQFFKISNVLKTIKDTYRLYILLKLHADNYSKRN